jgi:hypothetical protein
LVLPSNHPPVLAAISNQITAVGLTLTLTNSATDPDSPPQVLTFSLQSGTVTNATLNPTNGVFTWSPTQSEVGTNVFAVVVTDNGLPPLSATQSFSVTVLASNHPPVLTAIPNRSIYARLTLVLTNLATDPDAPPQVLTFSLDPGAPAGAIINATNGILVWTPTESQLGTNSITVRVTDNGLPNLSDAQTFTATVLAGPNLLSPIVSNQLVTVTWSAIAGTSYRLQFKANLLDTIWTDLSPDILASGPTASSAQTNLNSTGFYRVLVVP